MITSNIFLVDSAGQCVLYKFLKNFIVWFVIISQLVILPLELT